MDRKVGHWRPLTAEGRGTKVGIRRCMDSAAAEHTSGVGRAVVGAALRWVDCLLCSERLSWRVTQERAKATDIDEELGWGTAHRYL